MQKEIYEDLTLSRLTIAIHLALGAAAWQPAVAQQAATTLPTVTVTSDWLGTPTPATARKHPGARSVLDQNALAESGTRMTANVA